MTVSMCSPDKIRVHWVQEIVLLTESKEVQICLNGLVENPKPGAKLHILHSGEIRDLKNMTSHWLKRDWIYQLVQMIRGREYEIVREQEVFVQYMETPLVTFRARLAAFDMDVWPSREMQQEILAQEGFLPFTQITLKNLASGKLAFRLSFTSTDGVLEAPLQYHFAISGPDILVREIRGRLETIKDQRTKDDFWDKYSSFIRHRKEPKHEVVVLFHPEHAVALEKGENDKKQTILAEWPKSSPSSKSVVYVFSPDRLDFRLEMVMYKKCWTPKEQGA